MRRIVGITLAAALCAGVVGTVGGSTALADSVCHNPQSFTPTERWDGIGGKGKISCPMAAFVREKTSRSLWIYRSLSTLLRAPGAVFLAHSIRRRPRFDHIVAFRFLDQQLADREFPQTTPVEFSGREDSPERRIEESEEAFGFFRQSIGPEGTPGFRTQIKASEQIYLEIDELT